MNTDLIIGHYRIVKPLNDVHGIYLAEDEKRNLVVLKILTVYSREVYASLKEHPINNIPQIYDFVEQEDKLIVIEQYVEGINLQQLLDMKVYFDRRRIVDIMIQLCDILNQLHSRSIVHRDIKPSNVILSNESKQVYLIDFNASKFENNQKNMDTVLLGTVGYAAPEQYGFGVSSSLSDIYSLGVMLNVLVTGKFPNEKICGKPFNKIVKKCIELDSNYRYQSIDKLLTDIKLIGTEYKSVLKSFVPVGFRSGKSWKMIISVLVTGLYFCALFSSEVNSTLYNWWVDNILLLLLFLINVGFVFNYRGIRDEFDLQKKSFFVNVLVDIAVFMCTVLGAIIIEILLGINAS
ncbi:MAG: serine/threonine-protein kinase [Erysipelotrichia bacterium]|nr:serine/threonine-protein kinase [Erysipelotrichia bacterium]